MNSDIVILEYVRDILDEKKESIVQYIQVVQLTLHNNTVPTGCEHEAWGVLHLIGFTSYPDVQTTMEKVNLIQFNLYIAKSQQSRSFILQGKDTTIIQMTAWSFPLL